MKVQDIYDFLGEKAPYDTCEEWDNVGLLVGSGYLPVTRVLVALDATDGFVGAGTTDHHRHHRGSNPEDYIGHRKRGHR